MPSLPSLTPFVQPCVQPLAASPLVLGDPVILVPGWRWHIVELLIWHVAPEFPRSLLCSCNLREKLYRTLEVDSARCMHIETPLAGHGMFGMRAVRSVQWGADQ